MPAKKRDWYVAYGDMSGEFEGNPLSFEASGVYGPYTAEQALQLSQLSNEFPHATMAVEIFKACKMPFRSLLKKIQGELAEAKTEANQSHSED
jgi:hypothetical protein